MVNVTNLEIKYGWETNFIQKKTHVVQLFFSQYLKWEQCKIELSKAHQFCLRLQVVFGHLSSLSRKAEISLKRIQKLYEIWDLGTILAYFLHEFERVSEYMNIYL